MNEISRRSKVAFYSGTVDDKKCKFTQIVAELVIEENGAIIYCTEVFDVSSQEYMYIVTKESMFDCLIKEDESYLDDKIDNAIVRYYSTKDYEPDYLDQLLDLNEMVEDLMEEEGIDPDEDDGIILL